MTKRDAVKSLQSSLDAISTLNKSLIALPSSQSSCSASLDTVVKDYRSIALLIHKDLTALALALQPPKETWDAVSKLSSDITINAKKLVYAALQLYRHTDDPIGSELLYRQYSFHATDLLTALEAFYDDALKNNNGSRIISDSPAQNYRKTILVQTAVAWEIIKKAEALPQNSAEAFLVTWKELCDLFQDALHDLVSLTELVASPEDDAEEEDDELAEFGLGNPDKALSPSELGRAKACLSLVRLARSLLNRIGTASYAESCSPTRLRNLHTYGEELIAIQDDLVASMYSPHETDEVATSVKKYQQAIWRLVNAKIPGASDLEESFKAMDLEKKDEFQGILQLVDRATDQILGLCN